MNKKLKEELIALAEKILLLKQEENLPVVELKKLTQQLYEKLTVLEFTERNLSTCDTSARETVSHKPSVAEASEAKSTTEEKDEFAPDGTEFNDSEAITEPNTEKIKDIVAQMPPETQNMDEILEHILPKKYQKNDMEDIGGVHYDHLPQFEPVPGKNKEPEKPKSLNDRLKKSIQIGVNERHAFIRHLFDGSAADYNRVLSQLNTIKSKDEALKFVLTVVKPDYNNWEGKEEYEQRFLSIVENRFQ